MFPGWWEKGSGWKIKADGTITTPEDVDDALTARGTITKPEDGTITTPEAVAEDDNPWGDMEEDDVSVGRPVDSVMFTDEEASRYLGYSSDEEPAHDTRTEVQRKNCEVYCEVCWPCR